MSQDILAYVCPDEHGRNFWEIVANEYDVKVPFIFLGAFCGILFVKKIPEESYKKFIFYMTLISSLALLF